MVVKHPWFVGKKPAEVDEFFQDVQIWVQVLREGILAVGPESEISCSLKNIKPEKIGIWENFNRRIRVLVIS